MLLQALHAAIESKNLNLQVTLLVQKGVGTPFPPHYTSGYGLVWAVMINSSELPINGEARNKAHIANTDLWLYCISTKNETGN